jgi:hypothetical protein
MPSIWLLVVTVALVLALMWLAPWPYLERLNPFQRSEPEEGLWGSIRAKVSVRAGPGIMQIVVSLALLGVALYVILSQKYSSADNNWAYGIVGTIIGYWLKGQ